VNLSFAQKHDYDVIIVGARPAGSAAAYHLAKQGVDVLLVDRYAFPRDKCCGDAVMPPAMEELLLMGIADEVQHRYAAAKCIGVWLHGLQPNYSPVDASEHFVDGYIAPRASFDAVLCNHALQQGVSWLDGVVIQKVEENEENGVAMKHFTIAFLQE
jgi:flavin-dependent dehydrogenase